MQHLNQEIKKHLECIGCTFPDGEVYLADILRKENARKIWPEGDVCLMCNNEYPARECEHIYSQNWHEKTVLAMNMFQSHPETWTEEIGKLIMSK